METIIPFFLIFFKNPSIIYGPNSEQRIDHNPLLCTGAVLNPPPAAAAAHVLVHSTSEQAFSTF